jgi:hypothetical protein
MGAGVTLMFWKSENALLKVTVSPASARRMISSDWSVRAARSLKRHTETCKLFAFEADPNAEFEAAAGDHVDGRDILGKA